MDADIGEALEQIKTQCAELQDGSIRKKKPPFFLILE